MYRLHQGQQIMRQYQPLVTKVGVPTEIGDTRATIRDLTRQTTMHRKHLARLQKAKAVGEDA